MYRCTDCGKEEECDKTHEEMVAEYEMLYDKEYNPAVVVWVCDGCAKKLKRELYGG